MFALYSQGETDYAAVATPQLAMALALNQTHAYEAVPASPGAHIPGGIVPGYQDFPNQKAGQPRASAMVLTTEHGSPQALSPLYLIDRCDQFSQVPCDGNHDFAMVSSVSALQTASNQNYRYLGVQGYVYPTCTPYPSCAPEGTEYLHLKCNVLRADCAVFLERDRIAFEATGYTLTGFGMATSELGLAYPVIDSDGDGLADGMELVIRTSPVHPDSDGDLLSDGQEYPQAGVPVSDPCSGPNPSACPLPILIFRNGFEL